MIDLGCGGGRDAFEFLKNGWKVLAIDSEIEAIKFLQDGFKRSIPSEGVVKLDPEKEGGTDTLISEASIRSLSRHYREVMGL